jgi:hypothetical protein
MRGVKNFLRQNLPAMMDYILVVSTPIHDTYSPHSGHPAFSHQRLKVVNSLHQRGPTIPVLEREAVPLLPHVLDIPRHLACVSSSLMRSARLVGSKANPVEKDHLSDLCSRCFEVEEIALRRVSQLATVESHPAAPRWDVPRLRLLDKTRHSPPSPTSPVGRMHPQSFRPSTAPSPSDQLLPTSSHPLPDSFSPPNPSRGDLAVLRRGSVPETSSCESSTFPEDRVSRTLSRPRFLRPKSVSADSISTSTSISAEPHAPSPSVHLLRNSDAASAAAFDESGKKTKGIFNGLLIRR